MGLLDALGLVRASSVTVATDAPQKAMIGPGAYAMSDPGWSAAMNYGRWDTPRGMARAQALSHANPWIDKAERMICGRLSAMPWHLETDDDETVDDESPPELRAIVQLLERPSPLTRPRVTWRDLLHITTRHLGVINVAAWYLDALDVNGIPKEILYLNPARLTPVDDGTGDWWLDKDANYQGSGKRLEFDEVLLFNLVPPDIGWAGVGLVETAESKIQLSKFSDRFATQTYATGGRRGSWISPREGRMPDDVFDALVAGLKNIAESPDATKRNIVSKGAIDVTPQASTPQELQASDIMSMTRDDLLLIWNVDIADAGVPGGAGLSSGQMRSQARQSTFENAIEPRADVIAETIQLLLLDRYKAAGIDVELVVEKPEWEDETPAYERAAKANILPLRNHERRAIVGLEPFGDPALDNAVWLPAGIYEAYQTPDAVTGATVEPVVAITRPGIPLLGDGEVKAGPLGNTRTSVEQRITPKIRRDVEKVLAEFRRIAAEKAGAKAAHLRGKPSDVDAVFNAAAFEKAMAKAIGPHLAGTASVVTAEARKSLGHLKPGKAEWTDNVASYVLRRGGERVVEMAATSRADILAAIKNTVSPDLSIPELSAKLTDAVGGLSTWSDERAEMIARTETMFAYNDSALKSYGEFGVERVEAIDGDEDTECADRNGRTYTLDESLTITDHPNGTLDWVPVIKASLDEPAWDGQAELTKAVIAMASREPAPPIFNVHPADVHVHPAPVTVHVPEQPVTVNMPEQPAPVVNVTLPKGSKTIQRDAEGRITGITED
jgi:phage portal protein BeeE